MTQAGEEIHFWKAIEPNLIFQTLSEKIGILIGISPSGWVSGTSYNLNLKYKHKMSGVAKRIWKETYQLLIVVTSGKEIKIFCRVEILKF